MPSPTGIAATGDENEMSSQDQVGPQGMKKRGRPIGSTRYDDGPRVKYMVQLRLENPKMSVAEAMRKAIERHPNEWKCEPYAWEKRLYRSYNKNRKHYEDEMKARSDVEKIRAFLADGGLERVRQNFKADILPKVAMFFQVLSRFYPENKGIER